MKHLSREQLEEIRSRASAQFIDYNDQGYTAVEIQDEARANIRHFAAQLAQAERLLELAEGMEAGTVVAR